MKICKAIEKYLEWKGTYASTAPNRYKPRLDQFKKFVGNNKDIMTLTGEDVIKFHTHMKESNYSLATVAYSGRILKNFFDFWKGRGESTLNPKEIISAKYISPDKDVVNEEDMDDIDMVLDEHFRDDLLKKLIFHMLWDTGMRISELLDMNLDDIEEKNLKTGLRHAKVRSRKSMRYNLVVWGSEANRLLEKYLGYRLSQDTQEQALFISPYRRNLGRLTCRTIQRWVKEASEMASLDKNITPHSFRHGKAHQVLNSGGRIEDVQKILRHRSLESSLHYININPSKYMELAAQFLT
ncbi:MAG: integrase/recombinase XerD [Chitinophagales bacterium]|jgi:integrase/recombinase XerD